MKTKTTTYSKNTNLSMTTRLKEWWTFERLFVGGISLFLVVIIAAFILNEFLSRPPDIDVTIPDQSQSFASQEAKHLSSGDTYTAYNSNPPSSGPHYPKPADWGTYRQTIPEETLVHNLEHGGIWISYGSSIDEPTIQQLENIARRYPSHIIVTPRAENDAPITLAAWGRLLTLDTLDVPQINNFILRFRMKGPENVG